MREGVQGSGPADKEHLHPLCHAKLSQIYEDTKVAVAAVCMHQRKEEVTLVKWGISTSNSEFSENKSVARHVKLQTQRYHHLLLTFQNMYSRLMHERIQDTEL
jgi:hypothetical protein